jgi:hypothetical protein
MRRQIALWLKMSFKVMMYLNTLTDYMAGVEYVSTDELALTTSTAAVEPNKTRTNCTWALRDLLLSDGD